MLISEISDSARNLVDPLGGFLFVLQLEPLPCGQVRVFITPSRTLPVCKAGWYLSKSKLASEWSGSGASRNISQQNRYRYMYYMDSRVLANVRVYLGVCLVIQQTWISSITSTYSLHVNYSRLVLHSEYCAHRKPDLFLGSKSFQARFPA